MRPFQYTRATDASDALKTVSADGAARLLAGGTNIIDLMKEDVERPTALVDITRLKLSQIKTVSEGTSKGSLSIGGLAKNSDTANHPLVRQNHPLLTQAILAELRANPQYGDDAQFDSSHACLLYEVSMRQQSRTRFGLRRARGSPITDFRVV